MPRKDTFTDFHELLLFQNVSAAALTAAGALGFLPVTVVAAVAAAIVSGPWPRWAALAVPGYGLLAGAAAGWAYRYGNIPYRRGDLAAATALALSFTPAVAAGFHLAGQGWSLGPAILVSLLPGLALEVGWRPAFLSVLRRLSRLNLDHLVHEALREHYGDDWQAYLGRITADLREARRLRDLTERPESPRDTQ